MENQAVGNRTKHIDIRWHHMRSMMRGESPRLRVLFIRSENNFADLATKNVSEGIHNHLASQLCDGRIADVIYANSEREDVKNPSVAFVRTGPRVRFRSDEDDFMRCPDDVI